MTLRAAVPTTPLHLAAWVVALLLGLAVTARPMATAVALDLVRARLRLAGGVPSPVSSAPPGAAS